MHCDIVELADQLCWQVRIIGYLTINFFISCCCNLEVNSNTQQGTITYLIESNHSISMTHSHYQPTYMYIYIYACKRKVLVEEQIPVHYDPEESKPPYSQLWEGTPEDQHMHAIALNSNISSLLYTNTDPISTII